MSNQSLPQKNDSHRANHLQSESIPFALQSPHQLAQFAAATASGYHPKPLSKESTSSSGASANTTTASQPKPPTTQSDPPVAAYLTAGQGGGVLSGPIPQPIDLSTFKGLTFGMLDDLQLETREVYDQISGTFQWEMFKNQDDRCIKYVREQCANKRLFIITSGSLGRKVVPVIHDLPQVYAIYIYCADVKHNQEWAHKFTKIRVVCNDDDRELVPQLAVDVAQANIDYGEAYLQQGDREKAKPKFQKALDNLKRDPKLADPVMIRKVEDKLAQCK